MRLFATIAALLCMAACAARQEPTGTSNPPSLVGRWKSNTVPTGYWIIDRHADGRYASKFYLCHDRSQPHEIALEWGHWELAGKRYRHVIDGTNSEVLGRFVGKWREWPVISLTNDLFDFTVNDGDRHESRISITAALPNLKLPVPQDSPYGWTPSQNGIQEPSLKDIPDWVYSKPL